MGLKDNLIRRGGAGSSQKMDTEKKPAPKLVVKTHSRGMNISVYASTDTLDIKEQVTAKYGSRSFSRFMAKAMKEKVERDGGVFLDMDEV